MLDAGRIELENWAAAAEMSAGVRAVGGAAGDVVPPV